MRELGWNVTGMDFNPFAASQVARNFGIPVLVGSLPHPEVGEQSFDVITLGAVLEHVHRPHQIIEAATRALRPGGLLVVSVPNLESWGFYYFWQDWWPLELPRHLLHFNPATLRRLVEMHGLEVVELRMLPHTNWMRRSLERARYWHWGSLARRLLLRFGKLRIVQSLLTHWTVWRNQGDCLLLIARRPIAAPASTSTPFSKVA
jgi:SAM-dependent methyltransferase